MKKVYVTVSAIFVLTSFLFAQTGQLKFEHLSQFNSSIIGDVHEMHQDKRGYVWIPNFTNLVRYDGYQTKHYSLRGAKNEESDVLTVVEDQKAGLFALTSNNGLFKYDLARDSFVCQRVANTAKDKRIYYASMGIDSSGCMWIVAIDYTISKTSRILFRFNTQTRKTETFDIGTRQPDNPSYNYSELFTSASGNVWLPGTNGLLEYNSSNKKFDAYLADNDTLKRRWVTTMYEAPSAKGTIWLVIKPPKRIKKTPELWRIDETTKKAEFCADLPDSSKYPYDGGPFYTSQNTIREDQNKQLWITTFKCLFCYNPATKKLVKYQIPAAFQSPQYQNLHGLVVDHNGIFWLPSFGLIRFDPKSGEFTNYLANRSDPDALSHNHVTKLMIDRTGLLWVAMDDYGIDRVNTLKSAFKIFINNPHDPTSYPELVTDISRGFGKDFLISTQTGMYRWETMNGQFKKVTLPYHQEGYNDTPYSLVARPDGTLYYITQQGINILYPDKRHKLIKIPGWDNLQSLKVDRKGKLWAINDNKDLISLDGSGGSLTRYHYDVITPLKQKSGFQGGNIFLDSNGRTWVINDKYGLCLADTVKRKLELYSNIRDRLKLQNIFSVAETAGERLWLASRDGHIILYDLKLRKILKTLSIENDQVTPFSNAIAVDPAGKLWITTQNGLTKYDPSTDLTYTYSSANDISFDEPVGILNAANGNMILCMANSGFIFNPNDIKSNTYPPQLAIENITYSDPRAKLNSKSTIVVADRSLIQLTYSQNRITINYTGLHFVNPALNRYAYRLVGYENQWVQAGNNRSVTYNNLSPGTYTFKLMASNSDGVWTKIPSVITIIISPPWWLRWWAWAVWIVLFVSAVYAFIAYRSRKLLQDKKVLEQKVHIRTEEVMQQKEEIQAQRDNLEQTLGDLKASQTQLIQSEKMASLGELTAGIAHEIQNPLNFVNNFSEVNKEMLEELKAESRKPKAERDGQLEIELINDLIENEQKINHHGKRADSIVKGMLEHSRSRSGQKEPTDINTMADEFMRLSYHGLRSKDKTFNAEITANFDPALPKINVVQQDIGRVLLNLYNNAFYAVNQKQKTAGADYKPEVSVTTASENRQLVIKVKDNGVGIPDAIKEKIMQPFFTTKPTGEGTGLGLSLTYDMVVKGHGGSIQVDSVEGEGSEFIVRLPE